MKKQILSLTFFTLALIFAGMNNVFGQTTTPIIANGTPAAYENVLSAAPECITPTPLACSVAADELHPQAGILYTYTVTVSDPGNDQIQWFVTDETDLMVALNNITGTTVDPVDGSYVLAAGTVSGNAAYNTNTNTIPTIDITWKSFDGTANTVLLVTYVVNSAGCTDNIEVYRIEPVFNFTLDISGLSDAGVASTTPSECVSPIESATYDGTNLVMDYGENWVFFVVNAANFANSWMPSFQATYSGTVSDPLEVSWAYPADATANTNWVPLTETAGVFSSSTPVNAVDATVAGSGTGECIIVRVRVDHGNNENIVDQTLNLAVNGTMYNPSTGDYSNTALNDLGDGGAGNPCTQVDYDDSQNYILTARPDINEVTPIPFVPKN